VQVFHKGLISTKVAVSEAVRPFSLAELEVTVASCLGASSGDGITRGFTASDLRTSAGVDWRASIGYLASIEVVC
jgi:hypothetical protein